VTTVHAVLPDGVDDPTRPSGGNVYDRRVCRGLETLGWSVREHAVAGSWPRPDAASLAVVAAIVERIPDDAIVLVDGLIASAASEPLVPHASRLRLVVLVHMPLGDRPSGPEVVTREHAVLQAAARIVTTSGWTRARLLELYPALRASQIHVAHPGADPAPLAPGSAHGGELLCVAAVTAAKGQDLLLDALTTIADLPWRCVCVGALDRDPVFADELRRRCVQRGVDDRVSFPGPRLGADLDRSYGAADLLVLASRAETYGMVLTEALARGVPVAATLVGGAGEAIGYGADGVRPGLTVGRENSTALGAALRRWLQDSDFRTRLRAVARERRATLPTWEATASAVAGALTEAAR
jgi:glycosyltransferase involved in cell wall biosynthesis